MESAMENTNSSVESDNAGFVIEHAQFRALYDRILMCRELTIQSGEANCMALEGKSGAGKTTLLKKVINTFPPPIDGYGTSNSVLYVHTPANATPKGMAARMLEQAGDPFWNRGLQWEMDSRLMKFIKGTDTQIVILDDIGNLLDGRGRALFDVSEWLKVQIKKTNKPFIISGDIGVVRKILDCNEQLSRLFAVRETLPSFKNKPGIEQEEFGAFIMNVADQLGLEIDPELSSEELLKRIHYATDGVVANITNLLRTARYMVRQEDKTVATNEILREAYRVRLSKHINRNNPFENSPKKEFRAPPKVEVTT